MKDLNKVLDLIKNLDLDDLKMLNKTVVSLIRHYNSIEDIAKVAQFNIGDKVWFSSKRGVKIEGVVDKLNKKTIGVSSDGYGKWRVSAGLLKRCDSG